jgi:hypothetical protein
MAEMSWRNTMRRFVRDVMTGSATTAITNAASAITSRIRRGTAKPTTTVPPVVVASQPTPQAPLVTKLAGTFHQPRSLRAIAGERVLSDDRHNKSLFDVKDLNNTISHSSAERLYC